MLKGPKLNKCKMNITRRDNLGINGVYNSICANICPIVNNVTPRAFYWIFLTWIYYDYYFYYKKGKESKEEFFRYLKKQDFFFILSNLLLSEIQDVELRNIEGKMKPTKIIKNNPNKDSFECDRTYLKSNFGGMNYFNAGLLSMGIIVNENPETNKQYKLARLTQYGEKLAIAFENVIKDTEYYKKYRLYQEVVPKEVLIEYAKKINIGLNGFDECKTIFKELMFEQEKEKQLKLTLDYIIYVTERYNLKQLTDQNIREIFFDYFSPRGKYKYTIEEKFKDISIAWEIAIIRQYFALGLECIWNFMLDILSKKSMNKEEWVKETIEQSKFSNIEQKVEQFLNNASMDFDEIEDRIEKAKLNDKQGNLYSGLKIICAMYKRIENRTDLNDINKSFLWYGQKESISFKEWENILGDFREKRIKDLINYILNNLLIEQHYRTAFGKLLQGRDGFFFEKIDETYIQKENIDIKYHGIRAINVYNIAKDLDIIKEV